MHTTIAAKLIALLVWVAATGGSAMAAQSCPWDDGRVGDIKVSRRALTIEGSKYKLKSNRQELDRLLAACEMPGVAKRVSRWAKAEKKRGFVETKKGTFNWNSGRATKGRKASKKHRKLLIKELEEAIRRRPVILEERRWRNIRLARLDEALCPDFLHADATESQRTALMEQATATIPHASTMKPQALVPRVISGCEEDSTQAVAGVATAAVGDIIEQRKRSASRSRSRGSSRGGFMDVLAGAAKVTGAVVGGALNALPEDTRRQILEGAGSGGAESGRSTSEERQQNARDAEKTPSRGAAASKPSPSATRTHWVYGQVQYPDGSPCGKCPVSAATSSGVTDTVYADSRGNYRIEMRGSTVETLYIGGDRAWSGSEDCYKGHRIDLVRD